MVHATVSGSAAPSGTKQLYEVRPPDPCGPATVAVNQRRLRNLSVPTSRLGKTASSIPQGGDGGRQARSGGIETSVSWGDLPSAASAQLGCTRSSGRSGHFCGRGLRPRLQRSSSKVDRVRPAPARGPIQSRRGRAGAARRRGAQSPTRNVALSRSPGVPQLAVQLLGRAGVSGRCHHFLLLRGELDRHTALGRAAGPGPSHFLLLRGKWDRHTALNH